MTSSPPAASAAAPAPTGATPGTSTGTSTGPSPDRAAATIGLAILGIFVTYVPITSVSAALATIGASTHAGTSGLQWVSDAYVIPMAAAVLSAGVFGDLYGRRKVYLLGMVLTVLGGLVSGVLGGLDDANALHWLWTGQAAAGIGAGLLIPTTLALIAQAVPDLRARGKYIGLWSTGLTGGLALGPIVSGTVLRGVDWPWIFAFPTLLALLAALGAARLLPESAPVAGRSLDWTGQLTATVAIAALIFGIIEGSAVGWTSARAIIGLVLGALSLIAFLVAEARSASPLMDLSLFRSVAFSAANFAGMMAMFSVVGGMFLLSLYLGTVQHLDTLEIGVRLLFGTGVSAVIGPIVARLIHRHTPVPVLTAGLAICAIGMLALSFVDDGSGLWSVGWRLAIFGVGTAMMLSSVTVAAIGSAPLHHAGMAAATNTAIRQTGSALGPAILGAVYAGRLGSGATPADAFGSAMLTNVVLLVVAAVVCLIASRRVRRS
ncbi:MFS transporter [Nocardioides sp.]|uniref:MFS transporter n=1 Tax=Nocardioides sp. TaxID=35761 RepID=UPI00261AA0C0|nr:MFS transporter [Nocardioides sp.]